MSIELESPKRILIVCLRRLGDVILATSLAVSLRQRWPEVQIDWLVFEGTHGVLERNCAANRVITVPLSASFWRTARLALSLLGQYDLALSTQSGDRPSFLARLASPKAITFKSAALGGAIRDWFFTETVTQAGVHRVSQVLSLLKPLGVSAYPALSAPDPDFSAVSDISRLPIATFHPGAAFRYKQWDTAGWRALTERFRRAGYRVVVTGSDKPSERRYLDHIFSGLEVTRLDGVLSWPQLVGLLTRTEYFVGVDTSVTHLAAAIGVAGLAIYGPTDQRLWGPHPRPGTPPIKVIQNTMLSCVPCQQEGCNRHIESHAHCLDTLSVETIWSELSNQMSQKINKF